MAFLWLYHKGARFYSRKKIQKQNKKQNKMQKTLGGDRLGAGKRMKVELHGYERSTHNLGFLWRSTMSSGTLVPFLNEIALPGDTFDIDLECNIKTHPTIGPLFGSYKVQLDVFLAPIRLYHSALHNNALNIGRNMALVFLPQISLNAQTFIGITDEITDLNNSQINPSCILAYIGIRGVGWNESDDSINRTFCALSLLTYWDAYKNYYSNKQEEIGAVIHTTQYESAAPTITGVSVDPLLAAPTALPAFPAIVPAVPITLTDYIRIAHLGAAPPIIDPSYAMILVEGLGWIPASELGKDWFADGGNTVGTYRYETWGNRVLLSFRQRSAVDGANIGPNVVTFPLTEIDDMRTAILAEPPTNQFSISTLGPNLKPYRYLVDNTNNKLSTQEGLGVKTYQSDLFNNWLSTEWIDGPGGISAVTSIDTTGGSFSIDTLNLSRKVYNMLNRIAVSGGTYDDWLDVVYDHDRYRKCESPMYMGGLIKELVFQEVVSNSQSEGGGDTNPQPLGTLAGKGVMSNKHKGGKIIVKVDEPSILLGIISLTPRIDYSQGNTWHTHLQTMDDLHKPALDEIGFQELITEQMAWWDTRANVITSAWETKSAGKQPAWINYMTSINKTYGNFAVESNEMFMTLNRRFEFDPIGIKDLTTYIDPAKFNFIFANTALDAQNFWAQIAVDITARRKMSHKVMPNL